jgi:hypothetical protein
VVEGVAAGSGVPPYRGGCGIVSFEAMTMDEIQAEVNAVRAERRARESRG